MNFIEAAIGKYPEIVCDYLYKKNTYNVLLVDKSIDFSKIRNKFQEILYTEENKIINSVIENLKKKVQIYIYIQTIIPYYYPQFTTTL